MAQQRTTEISVGIFMLIGILALLALAFKVSGLTSYMDKNSYEIVAMFDNVGDLKPRAPVTIAGVKIGRVLSINLNPTTYRAQVILAIDRTATKLPTDTSASILTQGLLGSNYIALEPGYSETVFKDGDRIVQTHPALILENLIGQLLFKVTGNEDKKSK